ncbi:hypothetical protein V1264_005635 [Littorina saxatilis]|uniref:Uncharacterized protein n=1 Tax=Littorina saxatilis TaxID=31220 RepID=A0AAN9G5Q2_9CAEN
MQVAHCGTNNHNVVNDWQNARQNPKLFHTPNGPFHMNPGIRNFFGLGHITASHLAESRSRFTPRTRRSDLMVKPLSTKTVSPRSSLSSTPESKVMARSDARPPPDL